MIVPKHLKHTGFLQAHNWPVFDKESSVHRFSLNPLCHDDSGVTQRLREQLFRLGEPVWRPLQGQVLLLHQVVLPAVCSLLGLQALYISSLKEVHVMCSTEGVSMSCPKGSLPRAVP
eukprot:272515-Amphidinium_carterae.1